MSGKRAKAIRKATPKPLSLADRASAAFDEASRQLAADTGARKRSAETQAKEAILRALVARGITTFGEAVEADVTVDLRIEGVNILAVPFADVGGLFFSVREHDGRIALILARSCERCQDRVWTQNINSLADLGAALSMKWSHPEGQCPRTTEQPRHSRNARSTT